MSNAARMGDETAREVVQGQKLTQRRGEPYMAADIAAVLPRVFICAGTGQSSPFSAQRPEQITSCALSSLRPHPSSSFKTASSCSFATYIPLISHSAAPWTASAPLHLTSEMRAPQACHHLRLTVSSIKTRQFGNVHTFHLDTISAFVRISSFTSFLSPHMFCSHPMRSSETSLGRPFGDVLSLLGVINRIHIRNITNRS